MEPGSCGETQLGPPMDRQGWRRALGAAGTTGDISLIMGLMAEEWGERPDVLERAAGGEVMERLKGMGLALSLPAHSPPLAPVKLPEPGLTSV